MQKHGERAGVAAGLIGFSNSLFGALAAPLTSILFGLDVAGVSLFISIILLTAATLGLVGLRKEKAVVH
jgi:sugar phosphate permease